MTGGRSSGWWDEYRGKVPSDFLDVAELEHHATSLRTPQTAGSQGVVPVHRAPAEGALLHNR